MIQNRQVMKTPAKNGWWSMPPLTVMVNCCSLPFFGAMEPMEPPGRLGRSMWSGSYAASRVKSNGFQRGTKIGTELKDMGSWSEFPWKSVVSWIFEGHISRKVGFQHGMSQLQMAQTNQQRLSISRPKNRLGRLSKHFGSAIPGHNEAIMLRQTLLVYLDDVGYPADAERQFWIGVVFFTYVIT